MIGGTIGGIVAAQSVMWRNYGASVEHYDEEPEVQEKKSAPVVEYRNKNINRWAMKKPIERRA